MKNLPNKVNFDICTYCNHGCTFCSNKDSRTLKNQVSYEDYIKVMDNITKYLDIKEMGLSAKGEVLINKDFAKIVKVTKEVYNIPYLYISTNGALLDDKKCDEILKAGLDSIKFSINAIDKDEYKKVHLKDDFDLVIANLKNLIEYKKSSYPNLKILISVILDRSHEEIEEAFKDILKDDIRYIDKILKYSITFTPAFSDYKVDDKKLKGCAMVFNEIYIDSDCRLGLCCKDYFKEFDYGSLLDSDFLTLYNQKSMQDIRDAHKRKDFTNYEFCKKCLIFDGLVDE
jgi:MoaA/NifB/PqqE/SkfB family radical SAM enzyme